jgi:ssDNA-binding Zn-finger/Zn-ribbon topoisomerase 1
MPSETGQTLPNSASVSGADLKVPCPKCGELRGSRVKRRGFIQKQIMPFFGYFPWQCGSCRFAWNSKIRGEKKRRRIGKGPKAFVEPTLGFNEEPLPSPSRQIQAAPTRQPAPIDNRYVDDTHEDVE